MTSHTHSLLYQTVYVSSASDLMDETGLEKLLRDVRAKNAQLGVTGIMLYSDGNIMQVLEGEKQQVQNLMDKILSDPRHKGVIELLNEPIEQRQFSDWTMGYKKLNKAEAAGFSDFLNRPASNDESQLKAGRARSLLIRFRSSMS